MKTIKQITLIAVAIFVVSPAFAKRVRGFSSYEPEPQSKAGYLLKIGKSSGTFSSPSSLLSSNKRSSKSGVSSFRFISKSKKAEDEKLAFGTYAGATEDGSQVMTYRVRKAGAFGGYKIVTERVGGSSMSREALLNARAKKKADRFCM